jgi:carbamoyltransferase
MIHWGINALNHELESDTIRRALDYGSPDTIFWYERPWVKKARQLYAGQWRRAFDLKELPSRYLNRIRLNYAPVVYTPHHASHAAAGYYSSPFKESAIVVLDAIGEFECATIWKGNGNNIEKVWSKNYPNSLGLFYSAFADLIGFIPIQEEFKLQQLSDQGNPNRYYQEVKSYFNGTVSLVHNLHKGILNWPYEITEESKKDIAAAVQQVFEEQVHEVMITARNLTQSKNLVYMGGCAMNSKYNKKLPNIWNNIWSLPQPGDPSSSIGAVLYHTKQRVDVHNLGVVKHLEIRV